MSQASEERGHTSQGRYYAGVPMMSYDLIKELVLAVTLIGVIVLGAAFVMSSPDEPPVTIQSWAQADPLDFVTTATAELAGTSDSAIYGPPYTNGSDGVQWIGPFSPQQFFGNALHLDTAHQFVLDPLTVVAGSSGELHDALATYTSASADQQAAWTSAYADALDSATVADGTVIVAAGDYGPVPVLMSNELAIARSGSLDGLLVSGPRFYQTNYSAPLLFLGDGEYLSNQAEDQHLSGDQWGMMNETGSYPGQVWLLPVTLWYQIPPFDAAANADLLVMLTVVVLLLVLLLMPFIPILRDIPRWIPIHRLIWRRSALADPGPERK
jgi:hypothetical protein